MNVLSLFDGISCGRVALDRAWVKVDKYFASEIDKYAMQVSKKNYPDILPLWDVKDVHYCSISYHPNSNVLFPKDCNWNGTEIDLLIGWSPCQSFSVAGNQKWFEWKSWLFYEYERILKEVKPKYFLLENVKMKKEWQNEITKCLFGVEPIEINSSLVSWQNRRRLYWIGERQEDWNYKNVAIPQPDDKWILLKDILEDIPMKDERWKPLDDKYLTEFTKQKLEKHTKHIWKSQGRRINDLWKRDDYNKGVGITHMYETRESEDKTWTITTFDKDNIILCRDKSLCVTATYQRKNIQNYMTKNEGQVVFNVFHQRILEDKCGTLGTWNWLTNKQGYIVVNNVSDDKVVWQFRRTSLRVCTDQEKVCTLTANMGTGWNNVPIMLSEKVPNKYYWRKLTCLEVERLQTLPEWYTDIVSNSQRYKAIWNGWTVDVIAHIFNNLPWLKK